MSAFVTLVLPDGAYLLTDGAVWRDGVLFATIQKVNVPRSGGLAVTWRGPQDLGESIARELCAYADEVGTVAAIEDLQDFADDQARRRGVLDGWYLLQMCVIAYAPKIGGVHRMFYTCRQGPRPRLGLSGLEPYEVVDPGGHTLVSGTGISATEIAASGLVRYDYETDSGYFRRIGGGLMQIIRNKPMHSDLTGDEIVGTAGGHVDFTSLTANGSKIERLCTWPDEIGKPIDPTRRAA